MLHDVTIYKNIIIAFMETVDCGEMGYIRFQLSIHEEYDAKLNISRNFRAKPEETRKKDNCKNMNELYNKLKVNEIFISSYLREELKTLLAEFSNCFSHNKFDLGLAFFSNPSMTQTHRRIYRGL